MKTIVKFAVIAMIVTGCRDYGYEVFGPAPTDNIDLGTPATSNNLTTSGPVTSGNVVVTVSVTPGASYTIQLRNLAGDILANNAFVADKPVMEISLNYTNISDGMYDMFLFDNTGSASKSPLIIKN
jgi:hypothetical protein